MQIEHEATERTTRSRMLMEEARKFMPGGVNSPVRAFGAANVDAPFIRRAEGAYLYDEDGKRYIDYVLSWGPMIVGHAHPHVVEAVQRAAQRGTSYGAPTRGEIELAKRITEIVPSVEMLRLVNSGTEATMSAIRLARGATGRDKIIKFVGCYHGHGDAFLIEAGSGMATHGVPSSPGVPKATAQDTLTCPYNDLDAVDALLAANPNAVAAIIVEPVAGNMGCVLPEAGYLQGLRERCDRSGALLIFDEVMTGFRVGAQSAQGYYDIRPDLTTLGKVIGGGLPVGAYGGRRELMQQVSPVGPIYQAGTLSGNPLAVAAGLATLELLYEDDPPFDRLAASCDALSEGLEARARAAGVPLCVPHVGSMGGIFFAETAPRNFAESCEADAERFYQFHAAMLGRGVYLAPSPFEAFFLSDAHGEDEIERTLAAAGQCLDELKE
jgi:glutamate-1-semialdehyde 2,1-aminomutase